MEGKRFSANQEAGKGGVSKKDALPDHGVHQEHVGLLLTFSVITELRTKMPVQAVAASKGGQGEQKKENLSEARGRAENVPRPKGSNDLRTTLRKGGGELPRRGCLCLHESTRTKGRITEEYRSASPAFRVPDCCRKRKEVTKDFQSER